MNARRRRARAAILAPAVTACFFALFVAACGEANHAMPRPPEVAVTDDAGDQEPVPPEPNDAGTVDAPQSNQDPLLPLLLSSQIPAAFLVPGTQIGDVPRGNHYRSTYCAACHKTGAVGPYDGWSGSLMAQAARDPVFFAELATANQDVPGVGAYCLRCHVPNSTITGNAYEPTGSRLEAFDRDGVMCHFCHSLIDPVNELGTTFQDGVDGRERAMMKNKPAQYGNAMFVIAIGGERRGPYTEESFAFLPHEASFADYITRADLCGTCHDAGNPAFLRQSDGTYEFGGVQAPGTDPDPEHQFPLERTFTEWRLSSFAVDDGVDLGGKFGREGEPVVGKCQDCHMPNTSGAACNIAAPRDDLDQHEFAGSASWVLSIIGLDRVGDSTVDQDALKRGQANDLAMLRRATSLAVTLDGSHLDVKVTNDTGHKFPTGHGEGRRSWVNVVFLAQDGSLVKEYGGYRKDDAVLDEASTVVFEMKVGLSQAAAQRTGLPEGETTHTSLADVISKDTRIPPRGFDRERFAAAGAGAVAADYADGQYWADVPFEIPTGATSAEVTIYYQTMTGHYMDALKGGNKTNSWGNRLYDLWMKTDKAPPVPVAHQTIGLAR